MTEHSFTLYFDGADMLRQDHFDAASEGGCDDASFASSHGRWEAMFDREARSLPEAVFSAIDDLESSVPGLRVTRMQSDELVSLSVIARRTGRSRESIRLLATGRRGPGGFPEPVDYVAADPRLWQWTEVANWFARYNGTEPGAPAISEFVRALNAVLEARRHLGRLGDADPNVAAAAATQLLELLARSVKESAHAPHPA